MPKIENTISVDGVLAETVWESALVMGVNTEVRPGANIEVPVRTDMLLASAIPTSMLLSGFDPDPAQIYAHLCDHDNILLPLRTGGPS